MSKLVFLGGTVGNNDWRTGLIDALVSSGVDRNALFNPVVKDWNEEARINEENAKKNASHMIFFLANPNLGEGCLSSYSLVEATMALYDAPLTTVVVFDHDNLTGHALKAQKQSEKVLKARFPSANILSSRDEAITWLTAQLKS